MTRSQRAICKRGAARCVMSHSRIEEASQQEAERRSFLFSVVNQTAASCENVSTIEAFCGFKRTSDGVIQLQISPYCGPNLQRGNNSSPESQSRRNICFLAPQYTDKMMMGETIKIDHKDWPLNAIIINRT